MDWIREVSEMKSLWHSELRRKMSGGFKGSLQDSKKGRCSVIRSLPCPQRADQEAFLVVAPSLGEAPGSHSSRLLRG